MKSLIFRHIIDTDLPYFHEKRGTFVSFFQTPEIFHGFATVLKISVYFQKNEENYDQIAVKYAFPRIKLNFPSIGESDECRLRLVPTS